MHSTHNLDDFFHWSTPRLRETEWFWLSKWPHHNDNDNNNKKSQLRWFNEFSTFYSSLCECFCYFYPSRVPFLMSPPTEISIHARWPTQETIHGWLKIDHWTLVQNIIPSADKDDDGPSVWMEFININICGPLYVVLVKEIRLCGFDKPRRRNMR